MRRVKRFALDYSGLISFDFEETVRLLTNERDEAFEGERAIRLFQFRTWIFFPDTSKNDFVRHAGLIAAVKLLEQLEDDYFVDEEAERQNRQSDEQHAINLNDRPPQTLKRIEVLRRDSKAYRQIYDKLIGECGGLLALLYAVAF